MIRLAQLYTGSVGSEIVRRLAGHPKLQLVAVLVSSAEKAGKDSGTLVGAIPNGIITTTSIEDVLAAKPQAVIYSGMKWEPELFVRLLRAGINVYTGIGGFYLPGTPDFEAVDSAGREGNASFTAGGNIPGLISDVFPLFVWGYTGRIREIRVWQRNDVSDYPSAVQIQTGLGIGKSPGADAELAAMLDAGWTRSMGRSAKMVAAAMGIECTEFVLARKRTALAAEDTVLAGSGLLIKKGMVAGVEWLFDASCNGRKFMTITNQQTGMLGLGPGWRVSHQDPPWRVEIDGEPSIVASFGWPEGTRPGKANSLLNVSRAMNTIQRLVAARPGCVTVLDYPAPVAGDGLTCGIDEMRKGAG